ncbi:copper-binding protein [Novilysobacter erysipheiresistens]|uniref:Copper-binding protein n=1 Tax=Novilysobacter erysipheiresistens TaxID=1749332 RepID=A0ABU7YZB3_9GAMM
MKILTALLVLGLLAGCSSPNDQSAGRTEASIAETTQTAVPPSTTVASATGVVESVDAEAKTVTIAHGPVAALEWPAMTMTFQAPNVDLTAVEEGDEVSFDITSSGTDTTITSITRR